MDDTPEPFTDEQRKTFEAVAAFVESHWDSFAEADGWIELPNDPRAIAQRVRDALQTDLDIKLARIRCARNRAKPLNRADKARRARREPVEGEVFALQSPTAEERADLSEAIQSRWTDDLSINRKKLSVAIRRERNQARTPLPPYDLLQIASATLTRRPLDFWRMSPEDQQLWALRVLRVLWILTCTAKVDSGHLSWLGDWEWAGRRHEELIDDFLWRNCCAPTFGRSWAAHEIIDPGAELWHVLGQRSLAIVAALRAAPTTAPERSTVEAKSESKTVAERLEDFYKKNRGKYHELLGAYQGAKSDKLRIAAREAARRIFGRNELAVAVGCARGSITPCNRWDKIKQDFGFEKVGRAGRQRGGFAPANDAAAMAAGDLTSDVVDEREQLVQMIRESNDFDAAYRQVLLNGLEDGTLSPAEAMRVLSGAAEPDVDG